MAYKRTKNKAGWAVTGIALALVIIMLVLICLQVFTSYGPTTWFKPSTDKNAPTADSGMQIPGEVEGSGGISLCGYTVSVDQYEEYNVPTTAESAYRLKVVASPADAFNAIIDWNLTFDGADVSWGSETKGEVTDYVTFMPDQDGALEGTLVCLGAFGTPIKLTANVRGYEDIKVDYSINYGRHIDATFKLVYGDDQFTVNTAAETTFDIQALLALAQMNDGAGVRLTQEDLTFVRSDVYTRDSAYEPSKISVDANVTSDYCAIWQAALNRTYPSRGGRYDDTKYLLGNLPLLTEEQTVAYRTGIYNNADKVMLKFDIFILTADSQAIVYKAVDIKFTNVGSLVTNIYAENSSDKTINFGEALNN